MTEGKIIADLLRETIEHKYQSIAECRKLRGAIVSVASELGLIIPDYTNPEEYVRQVRKVAVKLGRLGQP